MSTDTPDPTMVLSFDSAHATLDRFVFHDMRAAAVDALRVYFHNELYTGRRFERLDSGGDWPEVANQLTGTDLVALPLLSVRPPGELVLAVLEEHAERIAGLLARIPTDVAMHQASWSMYTEGSPAHQLYDLLRSCPGAGRTTAYKLLARKRPHLLPVYDDRVRQLLGTPADSWACFWTWLQAQPERAAGIDNLRDEVGGIEDISLLRVLDVALWMHA